VAKEDVQRRLLDALQSKTGGQKPCALCGKIQWHVIDGFVFLPTPKQPSKVVAGGRGMPVLPLVCGNCGNTHLLNLFMLGFSESELSSLSLDDDGSTTD